MMDIFDIDVLLPRYAFVFLGWLMFSLLKIWKEKDRIDDIEPESARKKAWKNYKRKHVEDYPITLAMGLIFVTVMNVLVLVYDWKFKTDYMHVFNTMNADLGVSFLVGWFALKIVSFITGKVND